MTNDRKRLYLRQVDVVKAQDGEYLTQTSLFMGQAEYETRLVTLSFTRETGNLMRITHHKKTRIVMFVVVNILLQNFHAL